MRFGAMKGIKDNAARTVPSMVKTRASAFADLVRRLGYRASSVEMQIRFLVGVIVMQRLTIGSGSGAQISVSIRMNAFQLRNLRNLDMPAPSHSTSSGRDAHRLKTSYITRISITCIEGEVVES